MQKRVAHARFNGAVVDQRAFDKHDAAIERVRTTDGPDPSKGAASFRCERARLPFRQN